MTETGREELKLNVPETGEPLLNGGSVKNRAIWPWPGMIALPCPKSRPFTSVKKNEIEADSLPGFAMAMPVLTTPFTSTRIRPLWISGDAGTLASLTRVLF
jgi:hypothetical protein